MCSLLFDSSDFLGQRSLQKRICAVVIFCPKKLSSHYWQFFLLGLDYQTFLIFINLKDSAAFLGLTITFLLVFGTWECLVFDFSFFCGIMSFYVSISDAVFLVTSFSIFDQSVWLILSFWCASFYPFIDFYWSSGRCTSEFALECFCLNKVITNW